jgi:hypothetical protein
MPEVRERVPLGKLPPLAYGRAARVVFGIGALVGAVFVPWDEAGGVAGGLVLVFFGLSFLAGGLMANPGCEVTALPNLLLPTEKRVNFDPTTRVPPRPTGESRPRERKRVLCHAIPSHEEPRGATGGGRTGAADGARARDPMRTQPPPSRRPIRGRLAIAILLATAMVELGAAPVSAEASGGVIHLDCLADSPACPEVTIEGDPWFEIPGFGPSPFRGYGDPALRRDPKTGRLWLMYSYLSVVAESPGSPNVETAVSIHLASSDDDGERWRFRRRLWRASTETDPAPPGGRGLSVHEVSTLAPLLQGSRTRWLGLHFRYFEPFGPEGRRPGSFHFRLARANKPKALGRKKEARLGGPLTDPARRLDLDLSSLDPELAGCSIWTEPSLFGQHGRLYLVAQCLVIDTATGKRRRRQEFIGVFASDGAGPVDRLDWGWLGKLTDLADARALRGQVLTQPEVTTSRDGGLILLVTPKELTPEEKHLGCRAIELESLDPPRLRRDPNGRPIVRVDIRSSDSTGLGPGLCSYDPASKTGILFVRTEIDASIPDVVFRLHSTGLHP